MAQLDGKAKLLRVEQDKIFAAQEKLRGQCRHEHVGRRINPQDDFDNPNGDKKRKPYCRDCGEFLE